jgi:hypothetical protein
MAPQPGHVVCCGLARRRRQTRSQHFREQYWPSERVGTNMVPQPGHRVPPVPFWAARRAAARRLLRSVARCSRRRGTIPFNRHGTEQKTWGRPPRRTGNALPHASQCRSSPILSDANLVPLQAQGRLPSLADLRAPAGDGRAADICLSSTVRSSGTSRTWCRRSGMSSVGGTARASLADVRFLPSVGTGRNRSAALVPR